MPERYQFNPTQGGGLIGRLVPGLVQTVEALARPVAGQGLSVSMGRRGLSVGLANRPGFWAQLTAPDATGQGYAWNQMLENGDGTFMVDPNGRTSDGVSWPAFAVPVNTTLAVDGSVIVWLTQGKGEYYEFQAPGSGSSGGGPATLFYSDGGIGTGSAAPNSRTILQWGGLNVPQVFMPAGGSDHFAIPNQPPFQGGGRYEVSAQVHVSPPTNIGADYALRIFQVNTIPLNWPQAGDFDSPGLCSTNGLKIYDSRALFLAPGDQVIAVFQHDNTGITHSLRGDKFFIEYKGPT